MHTRILLLVLLLPFFTKAQTSSPSWGTFSRAVPVKEEWKGKSFRLQARVKTQAENPNSWAGIWARVDATGGQRGFFDNMQDRGIRKNEWTNCVIKGPLKGNDSTIALGGLYIGPGTYAFDDFKLEVETAANKWEQVALPGMALNDTADLRNWYKPPAKANTPYTFAGQFLTVNATALGQPKVQRAEESMYGKNDKAGHFANVNGIKIYYEVYGKGEPLVLLHGNSQSIVAFTYMIPELSKKYKVIAVDTRLQGRSGDDGTRLTYDLFAEDVKGLIDHLKLKKVNLFGWSDGGNTGLILAGKYPERVKTLMTMGANLQPDTLCVKPDVLNVLSAEIAKLPPEKTKEKRLFTLCLEEPHISKEQITKIQCPTLVMAGDDDMIQDAHTRLIAATIPKGELLIFEKATHFAPFEIPEKFNKAMEDFLARHK